jgi:hypothetical protein
MCREVERHRINVQRTLFVTIKTNSVYNVTSVHTANEYNFNLHPVEIPAEYIKEKAKNNKISLLMLE